MAFPAWPKAARSLRHRVAEALREAIVSGQLVPGHRLVEEEVSEQMQISRGTVREALRQLEQEGLIMSFPYRGTVVMGVTDEEVVEVLIPIRLTLEGYVLRCVLERVTEADYAALEALVDVMKQAAANGDLKLVVEADMQFHEEILTRSQQLHSLQIWQTIAPRIKAYFFRSGPGYEDLSEVAEQHREFIRVMRTGDRAAMMTLLERHIRDGIAFRPAKTSE